MRRAAKSSTSRSSWGPSSPLTTCKVKEPLRFSGPVLADIFLGKIKKWNDKALQELNPGGRARPGDRGRPPLRRQRHHPHLGRLPVQGQPGVEEESRGRHVGGVADRRGEKGNEGVAGQVRRSSGGIGYIELIYALQNDIKFGLVQNKEGDSQGRPESVTAAAESALSDIPDDLRYSITNAHGKDSYPISGTVWAVSMSTSRRTRASRSSITCAGVPTTGKYCEGLHYARCPGPGRKAGEEARHGRSWTPEVEIRLVVP